MKTHSGRVGIQSQCGSLYSKVNSTRVSDTTEHCWWWRGRGIFIKNFLEKEKFHLNLEGWEDLAGSKDSLAGTHSEDSREWMLTGIRCRSVLSWEMISTVTDMQLRVLGSPQQGLGGWGCHSVFIPTNSFFSHHIFSHMVPPHLLPVGPNTKLLGLKMWLWIVDFVFCHALEFTRLLFPLSFPPSFTFYFLSFLSLFHPS